MERMCIFGIEIEGNDIDDLFKKAAIICQEQGISKNDFEKAKDFVMNAKKEDDK